MVDIILTSRLIIRTCLLALILTSAGCLNPYASGGEEYAIEGKVVEDPPDEAGILEYTNQSIRSEDPIQEVVVDAIAVYENRSGTPQPDRMYHAEQELNKSQYRGLSETIAALDDYPADNQSAIYVQRDSNVVKIRTRTVVNV